jgi:hypothetical protein
MLLKGNSYRNGRTIKEKVGYQFLQVFVNHKNIKSIKIFH